jgi:DNA-binding GntR family transcriptional regulator
MVEYKSIKEYIYDHLSARIYEGKLKPGQKINEKAICEDLQVSRTPVREALIELADEGLLSRIPRRGFRVSVVSLEEVREVSKIIGCLEGQAAVDALPNMDDSAYSSMEKLIEIIDVYIRLGRFKECYRFQHEFHDVYILLAGNRYAHILLTTLKNRFIRQAYAIFDKKNSHFASLQRFNDEHREILRLFRKGDVEALRSYIKDVHWISGFANLDSQQKAAWRARP